MKTSIKIGGIKRTQYAGAVITWQSVHDNRTDIIGKLPIDRYRPRLYLSLAPFLLTSSSQSRCCWQIKSSGIVGTRTKGQRGKGTRGQQRAWSAPSLSHSPTSAVFHLISWIHVWVDTPHQVSWDKSSHRCPFTPSGVEPHWEASRRAMALRSGLSAIPGNRRKEAM